MLGEISTNFGLLYTKLQVEVSGLREYKNRTCRYSHFQLTSNETDKLFFGTPSMTYGPVETYKYSMSNIFSYLFVIPCLANQQQVLNNVLKFKSKIVIIHQNETEGTLSPSAEYPLEMDPFLIQAQKIPKGRFFYFSSILISYYCF